MRSHPATKQDLWVLDKRLNLHTFCEVGAYDGLTHSNTALLEESGWAGMLIEAHKPYYEKCVRNRPEALCVNAAIGGEVINTTLRVGGEWTGLDCYLSEENLKEHYRRHNPYLKICTHPLIEFVSYVDYLSIDTEGGEAEILNSWFIAGGRCKLLTVEFNFDNKKFERLVKLCGRFGMELDEVRGFDLCFVS